MIFPTARIDWSVVDIGANQYNDSPDNLSTLYAFRVVIGETDLYDAYKRIQAGNSWYDFYRII